MDTIWLIRHGEKPSAGFAGIDDTGAPDDDSLAVRGWQRAGAWAVYFAPLFDPQHRAVYASSPFKVRQPDGTKDGSHSRRPVETTTPCAQRIGVSVTTSFGKHQEAELATQLLALSGTTLVCWQHEDIPHIATDLLPPRTAVPAAWPGARFDVVWRFQRRDSTRPFTFDQLCPVLLAGDSPSPIS